MGLVSNALALGAGYEGYKLVKNLFQKRDGNQSLISKLIGKGKDDFTQQDNYYQNSKATSILSQRGFGQNALAAAGLFAGGKVVFDALTGKYRTNGQGGIGQTVKNVGKSVAKGLLVFGAAKQGLQFLAQPSLKNALKLAASIGIAALGTKLLNRSSQQQQIAGAGQTQNLAQTSDQAQNLGTGNKKSLGNLITSKPVKFLTGAVMGFKKSNSIGKAAVRGLTAMAL